MQVNHPIRRGVFGAAVAASSILAASCSAPASPEVERTEWSITDPAVLTPTTDSVDQCAILSQQDPLLDFAGNRFGIDDEKAYTYKVRELIDLAAPAATPPEFATHVVTSFAPNTAQPGVNINIDVSTGFEHWLTPADETIASQIQLDKSRIIDTVGNVTYTMNDYPTGFFGALGIKTVDLSDTYPKGDDTAGFYDSASGKIHIEADMYEKIRSEKETRFILSHEIGHAIHDHWCGGADSQDDELAGDITFYGFTRMKDADGANIPVAPKETLVYGPDRIYPGNEKDDYTASNVQEYFAGIVAFTVEKRGLILPGDADYGSILQKNQEMVVDRAEKLFPGFRAFAEERTKVLRLSYDNEIYQDAEKVEVKISDLRTIIEAGGFKNTVMNGVMLYSTIFTQSYGQSIVPFPVVSENYSDPDEIELKTELKDGLTLSTKLSGEAYVDDDDIEVVMYKMPDSPEIFINEGGMPSIDQYGLIPGTERSTNTPEAVAMIEDLVARGAKPVRVVFVKD